MREALAIFLSFEGYEVSEAPDGQAAWEAMQRETPSAVVLDLMMPVMDGWTLRRHMKADANLALVPIIIVSGASDLTGFEGECAVLRKPVEVQRLAAAVERCTRRGH